MQDVLAGKGIEVNECLLEYKIDRQNKNSLLKELSVSGVSAATIFPDLDHLAFDLISELELFNKANGAGS